MIFYNFKFKPFLVAMAAPASSNGQFVATVNIIARIEVASTRGNVQWTKRIGISVGRAAYGGVWKLVSCFGFVAWSLTEMLQLTGRDCFYKLFSSNFNLKPGKMLVNFKSGCAPTPTKKVLRTFQFRHEQRGRSARARTALKHAEKNGSVEQHARLQQRLQQRRSSQTSDFEQQVN